MQGPHAVIANALEVFRSHVCYKHPSNDQPQGTQAMTNPRAPKQWPASGGHISPFFKQAYCFEALYFKLKQSVLDAKVVSSIRTCMSGPIQ